MILERYVAREAIAATLAIALVLMIVVMSGRMSAYIDDAAAGRIAAELVFPLLVTRLPEFLELVLPLALFLGVLIALMQLRQSSEMTVMTATGFGGQRLLAVIAACALVVALVVASFSFYLSPRGGQYVNNLISGQGLQSELSVVIPERFYRFTDAGDTLYASEILEARTLMRDVMLSRVGDTDNARRPTIILAEQGYPLWADNGGYYFVLENGARFEGTPGEADFRVTRFERFHHLLSDPEPTHLRRTREQTLVFHELLALDSPAATAEIHWRLSLPVLVVVLALVALPLSESAPRQGGRYARVIPGVVLYMLYLVLLNSAREAVIEGDGSNWMLFWVVHALFGLFALLLAQRGRLQAMLRRSP